MRYQMRIQMPSQMSNLNSGVFITTIGIIGVPRKMHGSGPDGGITMGTATGVGGKNNGGCGMFWMKSGILITIFDADLGCA